MPETGKLRRKPCLAQKYSVPKTNKKYGDVCANDGGWYGDFCANGGGSDKEELISPLTCAQTAADA